MLAGSRASTQPSRRAIRLVGPSAIDGWWAGSIGSVWAVLAETMKAARRAAAASASATPGTANSRGMRLSRAGAVLTPRSTRPGRMASCAPTLGHNGTALADAVSRSIDPGQHPPEDLEGPPLGERLVEVAALRRLHARRTPLLAPAFPDQAVGVGHQGLELPERLAGDADAPGVPVVDEDRRPPGLGVGVGREAADVPAVAHRQQGEDRDLGVLGGVERPEQELGREVDPEE